MARMRIKPADTARYRDGGAAQCPYCSSAEIEACTSFGAESSSAWQDVRCTACGELWQEIFEIVAIGVYNAKRSKVAEPVYLAGYVSAN
jgi:hypothetical protein